MPVASDYNDKITIKYISSKKIMNEPHCGVIVLRISSSNDWTHWIIVSGLEGGG